MGENLLPPTSWTERKRKELHEVLPTLHEADKEKFIYLGCCIDFTADDINELDEANDESWPGEGNAVEIMREHCAGFDQWAETMGYVLDPSQGLTVENDQCLSYGKSWFRGVPCYYVDHSRIEYIWVDREYIRASFESPGVVTGRMSCSQPNIANKPGYGRRTDYSKPNPAGQIPSKSPPPRSHEMHTHDDLPTNHLTPAEVAKGRAMAKKPQNFSEIAHSSQEMREHAMQIRQEDKAQRFNQGMVAKGMSFEHFARQEASSIAMGFPPGDHEVTLDASDLPDDVLSELMTRGVTCDTEKLQRLVDDANAVSNHSLKETAKALVEGFGDDPFAMKVIPLAISMDSMEKWGCPYCGYCQGSIPATAEGTILWVCADCSRGCHVLAQGLEMSAIAHLADIYPQLYPHPRAGQPKRSERRVTNTHVQDSNSQDDGAEGLGDGAEGQ